MGKGENADYQDFVLFPQCFQKSSDWVVKSSPIQNLAWSKFKAFTHEILTLYQTSNF